MSNLARGIYAFSRMATTDITIIQTAGTITGGTSGIYSVNNGTGSTTIATSGDVMSKNGSGIHVVNRATATDIAITQTVGSITGSIDAIDANNIGKGITTIEVSGTVTGGSGAGIHTTGKTASKNYITLNNEAEVTATSAIAIKDEIADSIVTLNSGSKVAGSILLGDGSDTLTLNRGTNVTNVTVLDGGDNTNTTDGMTDILNINQSITGSSASIGGVGDTSIVNWETIHIGDKAVLNLSGDLSSNEVYIEPGSTISLSATVKEAIISGNVNNSGTIELSRKLLTIEGNYVGSYGYLLANTVLGEDHSATDKLIITGSASGITYMKVNNLGGTGSQTIEGITIIESIGASDASAFVQGGRIVAGAYEYSLASQATDSGSQIWYLTSQYQPTASNVPGSLEHNSSTTYVLRPEAGSYLANLSAANSMFNLRLHDRIGEVQYTDLLTGEQKVTSMWLRYQYGYNKFDAVGGQLKSDTHWNVAQLGGDVAQWTSNDTNRFHLGLMWGYGRGSSDTDTQYSRYRSSGKIEGYSVGLYGTWYNNDTDKTGLYVDSWLLWNDFDASVDGEGLDQENYNINGLTASVESGYTFKLAQSDNYSYWLQPKGQITRMNVDADNHTESNGTRVTGNANNWETRLGIRATMSSGEMLNSYSHQAGQLFMEANWIYHTKPFEVEMDGAKIKQDGTRNIGEIKVGVEGNIYKNTNIWFNLAYQNGDHDYSNAALMLGAKYSF